VWEARFRARSAFKGQAANPALLSYWLALLGGAFEDGTEQLPALAGEAHHLHLLDRGVIVRAGVDRDARQQHGKLQITTVRTLREYVERPAAPLCEHNGHYGCSPAAKPHDAKEPDERHTCPASTRHVETTVPTCSQP
jgi:hypothetical protein